MSEIRGQDLVLQCSECEHVWWEKVDLPMDLSAFLSRLKGAIVCPSCGRKGRGTKILTGDRRRDAVAEGIT